MGEVRRPIISYIVTSSFLIVVLFLISSFLIFKTEPVYLADGFCDACGSPAWYGLYDTSNKPLGEFCIFHAAFYLLYPTALFPIAIGAPFELKLLSVGPPLILAGFLTLFFSKNIYRFVEMVWDTGIGMLLLIGLVLWGLGIVYEILVIGSLLHLMP